MRLTTHATHHYSDLAFMRLILNVAHHSCDWPLVCFTADVTRCDPPLVTHALISRPTAPSSAAPARHCRLENHPSHQGRRLSAVSVQKTRTGTTEKDIPLYLRNQDLFRPSSVASPDLHQASRPPAPLRHQETTTQHNITAGLERAARHYTRPGARLLRVWAGPCCLQGGGGGRAYCN